MHDRSMEYFDWTETPFLTEEEWTTLQPWIPLEKDARWYNAPIYDSQKKKKLCVIQSTTLE